MAQVGDGPMANPDSNGNDNQNPNQNPYLNVNQNPNQNQNQNPDNPNNVPNPNHPPSNPFLPNALVAPELPRPQLNWFHLSPNMQVNQMKMQKHIYSG